MVLNQSREALFFACSFPVMQHARTTQPRVASNLLPLRHGVIAATSEIISELRSLREIVYYQSIHRVAYGSVRQNTDRSKQSRHDRSRNVMQHYFRCRLAPCPRQTMAACTRQRWNSVYRRHRENLRTSARTRVQCWTVDTHYTNASWSLHSIPMNGVKDGL
jgi:hypothetical protein